jgi:hypothetical protein
LAPVDHIDARELRHHLEYIASDALEGRDALSPGFREAADYVGAQLREAGCRAGRRQPYLLSRMWAFAGPLWTPRRHRWRSATRASRTGPTTWRPRRERRRAGLVYVGHGWRVPSKNLDPFKGLDVKGKWLVILPGSPEELTPADLARMVADVDFVQPGGQRAEVRAHRHREVTVVVRRESLGS